MDIDNASSTDALTSSSSVNLASSSLSAPPFPLPAETITGSSIPVGLSNHAALDPTSPLLCPEEILDSLPPLVIPSPPEKNSLTSGFTLNSTSPPLVYAVLPLVNPSLINIASNLDFLNVEHGNEPSLVSFDILIPLGLRILMPYKILICIECEEGVLPSGVPDHLRKAHCMTLKTREHQAFEELCMHKCVIQETSDIPNPSSSSSSSPLPGLKFVEGHCCNTCPYSTKELKTLGNHWYAEHSGPFSKDVYHQGALQTFFMSNVSYFEVRLPSPMPSPTPSSLLYDMYLNQISPTLPTLNPISSMSDNDILPLLKVTNWNNYVAAVTGPDLTVDDLMAWVAVPTGKSRDTWEGNVRGMVLNYLKRTRDLAHESELPVRGILMEAPWYVMFLSDVLH